MKMKPKLIFSLKKADCTDRDYGGTTDGSLWHWWIRTKGVWRCNRCKQTVKCSKDIEPPTYLPVKKIRADIKAGKCRWIKSGKPLKQLQEFHNLDK